MSAYIKAITTAAAAGVSEDFILINVDGVDAITFGGTPGASHIINIYYNIISTDAAAAPRQYIVNVAIPNGNTTTAANIRLNFYRAMATALQSPGSLPLLFETGLDGTQELVTSAAAGSAAI
mgnify:FL=1|tara:strand:+ start:299 stop:664 length:366 start_codon:yes stop_codon:yes gene_type:complete